MVRTNDIIAGELNKIYNVPIKEILTWYPGDFSRSCDCIEYHICYPINKQWNEVLDRVDEDPMLPNLIKSLKTNGVAGALSAKITSNDHVVLLDGHHRVGVVLYLQLKEVPVFIGDKTRLPEDLIALDSGWWKK